MMGLRKFVPDPPTEPQLAAISNAVTPPAPVNVPVGIIDSWLHKLHGRGAIAATEVRDLLLDVRNAVS